MSVTFLDPDPENWEQRTRVKDLIGVSKTHPSCSFGVLTADYGKSEDHYLVSVPWDEVEESARDGGWSMATEWRTGSIWTLTAKGDFDAEARLSVAKQPGPPDTAILEVTKGG